MVLSAGGDREARLRRWVVAGTRLASSSDLSRLVFDRDGAWMRDRNGALWSFRPAIGTFGLLEGGLWEPGEVDLLRRHLADGGVFADVGAGIGTFAVELARTIPGLEVHAFEPVPAMRDALLANIAKNEVGERVHVSPAVVLDRSGPVRITTQGVGADHVVTHASDAPSDVVEAITLDAYFADHGVARVDAIKIDVEGAELLVLQGASKTLERDHPLLIVEIEERWTARFDVAASATFELLKKLGYGVERMDEWRVAPSTGSVERDLSLSSNFVFRYAPK